MSLISDLKKVVQFRNKFDDKAAHNQPDSTVGDLMDLNVGGVTEGEVYSDAYADASLDKNSVRDATATVRPGDNMKNPSDVEPANAGDTSFSYIDELRKLAKKYGQDFKEDKTGGGLYLLERNGAPEITIDKKFGMNYYGANPEGEMFQEYTKLAARKYAENNRILDVWLNEKLITDPNQKEAFFRNTTQTLLDSGIDINRIRFKNSGFDHIKKEFEDKIKDKQYAPSYQIGETGDVVFVDRTKQDRETDYKIQNALKVVAVSLSAVKKLDKESIDAAFKNLKMEASFAKDGQSVSFKFAQENGKSHDVAFKISELAPDVQKGVARLAEIHNQETANKVANKVDNKSTAENTTDKPASKPEPAKKPAAKTTVDKPNGGTDTVVLENKLTAIINKSLGNPVEFDKLCAKENITVKYTDNNKSVKAYSGDDKKNTVQMKLDTDAGKLLTKNQTQLDAYDMTSAAKELDEKAKATSTSKYKS
jgi:hypothetical protein